MDSLLIHRDSYQPMRKDDKAGNVIFTILFAALLVLSAFLFIRCTPDGVGLVSDSVNYINGARSIASGDGYFRQSGGGELKAITNFPPLYSIFLAVPFLFGVDWQLAVWWVSLFFFILNTALIIRLIWLAGGSRWAGLLGAAMYLAMRPYLYYQFYAMSEPVYYFCTLLAFICMIRGFREKKFLWWLACGIACGGAFLARYIGIVSLCAIFGAVIVFSREKRGRFLAGLFCGAIPPVAAWLVRNALITGNASNRQILSHWVTMDDLRHGVMILWRWLFPSRYGGMDAPVRWMVWAAAAFMGLSLIFCLIIMIIMSRADHSPDSPALLSIWTWLLFIVGYNLFVVLTISLFDASVNIEERILFPAFMIFFLIFPTIFGRLLKTGNYLPSLLPLAAVIFFTVTFALDTATHLSDMAEHGYGWGWEGWNTSPAMQIIRGLPEDKVIYSNQIEAVSLWTGRGSYALLDPVDPSSEQVREGYQDTLNEIRRQVNDGEAVLVFFGITSWVADGDNWITDLCEGLPFIYRDTSEWVVGKE